MYASTHGMFIKYYFILYYVVISTVPADRGFLTLPKITDEGRKRREVLGHGYPPYLVATDATAFSSLCSENQEKLMNYSITLGALYNHCMVRVG